MSDITCSYLQVFMDLRFFTNGEIDKRDQALTAAPVCILGAARSEVQALL